MATSSTSRAAGSTAPGSGARPAPPHPDELTARQRARRDRIVSGALALMMERPFEAVQMKDVAAASDVALGTVYRYFSSKDHLFAEAFAAWARQYRPDAPGVDDVPEERRNLSRLTAAYQRAVRAFEVHPEVYGHLLAIQSTADPQAVEIFKGFVVSQNDAFASALARVASPKRERIIAVMNAVLNTGLRDWTLGRTTIVAVYDDIASAADLMLG
jgi:AcrR family transcriptional regulator